MIPKHLETLFWDIDLRAFRPETYPDYTIFRVLEYGDESAVAWLRQTFSESEIRRVLCSERRLSPKSANFWALVYGIPFPQVAALNRITETNCSSKEALK
jgi:Family of unknown function (DUF6922)